MNRIFLTHNWFTIWIFLVFFASQLAAFILICIYKRWEYLVIISFTFPTYLFTQFSYPFNLIVIRNGMIYSPHSLSIFPTLQKKVKVKISDIVYVEFGYEIVRIYGKVIKDEKYRCIKLALNNEKIEKIFAVGFTKKQIKKIESTLQKNNSNLLFEHYSNRDPAVLRD